MKNSFCGKKEPLLFCLAAAAMLGLSGCATSPYGFSSPEKMADPDYKPCHSVYLGNVWIGDVCDGSGAEDATDRVVRKATSRINLGVNRGAKDFGVHGHTGWSGDGRRDIHRFNTSDEDRNYYDYRPSQREYTPPSGRGRRNWFP